MNKQMIEAKVNAILCDLCGAGEDDLAADLNLFDEGLLDSFAVIQLLMELEDAFGISFNIEDLSRKMIATPLKIARLVQEALV